VLDLHKLFVAYQGQKVEHGLEDFDVYVLKSVKLRGDSVEQVVTINQAQKALVEEAREKFRSLIGEPMLDSNPQLIKALLAELVSDALASVKTSKPRNTKAVAAKGGNSGKVS